MKNVQIPYDLFVDLCKYHLLGVESTDLTDRIKAGLKDKMERVAAHENYSKKISER